jgi:hypothetical protein
MEKGQACSQSLRALTEFGITLLLISHWPERTELVTSSCSKARKYELYYGWPGAPGKIGSSVILEEGKNVCWDS